MEFTPLPGTLITSPVLTFHDPLAAAVIFKPDLVTCQEGYVQVELESSRLFGMTQWDPGTEEKPHRIATDVNVDGFFEEYFGTLETYRR